MMTRHHAIGRQTTRTDRLDAWRAEALHATLDLDGPSPINGTPLPEFQHWIYFLEAKRASALGRDGHPARGDGGSGFIPDLGLPRRMWAGGRLSFHAPLIIGSNAQRVTTIADITQKTGRTGPLAFVSLCHQISIGDQLCLTENQDIVYREDPVADGPKPKIATAPIEETRSRIVKCNPTMLFRYSALTFNGHRIHYDRDYARDVEGYPGLVVHGPLIAQMMLMLAAIGPIGPITHFAFRARSPAFDFEEITLCARDGPQECSVWARGPDGRLIMDGAATSDDQGT